MAAGFRVGTDLRAARERLGWDLAAVAAGLRIREPYLVAIEEGRLEDLPGNAYAMGFLRTYAGCLGLDPDEVSRRFRAEAADVNRKTELTFPAPVPERGVPAGAVALVGVVLAIGAYVGWYHFSAADRQAARVVPDVPARLAALPGVGGDVATPSPQVASVLPSHVTAPPTAPPAAAAPSAPAAPPAHMGAAPPPLPDVSPTQAAAATPPSAAEPASVPSQAPAPAATANETQTGATQTGATQTGATQTGATQTDATQTDATQPAVTQPAVTQNTTAVATPDTPHVLLRATADAWVQVREKKGRVLLNRVLRPGETWPVPSDEPQLLLTTGNAGGTELVVDGVATAPLGSSGAVRRDLPLDPALIRQGVIAPAAVPGAPNSTTRAPPR
jgi:cytoskeleton protein RodZ